MLQIVEIHLPLHDKINPLSNATVVCWHKHETSQNKGVDTLRSSSVTFQCYHFHASTALKKKKKPLSGTHCRSKIPTHQDGAKCQSIFFYWAYYMKFFFFLFPEAELANVQNDIYIFFNKTVIFLKFWKAKG